MMISGVSMPPAVASSYDSSRSRRPRPRLRPSPPAPPRAAATGISLSRSARSSYSISSSTPIRRSRSSPSIRRSCSSSGSSSSRSARRSSSIASASWRRCEWGRARTTPATSEGCMSRRRAASAAASLGAAHSSGTSRHSASRKLERRRSELRRASRILETSQRTPRTVFDLDQADVADRLAADVAVDQLGRDQRLAGAALERVQVEVPAAQPDAVVVEPGDTGGVDEDLAALAGGDEPDDAGRRARPAGHEHDVGDLADLGSAGVEQRQTHHPECVDDVACHAAKATRRPSSAPVMKCHKQPSRDRTGSRRARSGPACR